MATAKLDSLLAAKRGLERAQSFGDVAGFEAEAARRRVHGKDVVAVVETAEQHLDSRSLDRQGEAVEAVELDVGGLQLGLRPCEVVVGAAIDTVVADVHGVEDEARAAPGAGAGVGGVRKRFACNRWIVEAVPERRSREAEANLGDYRDVGVQDWAGCYGESGQRLLDL